MLDTEFCQWQVFLSAPAEKVFHRIAGPADGRNRQSVLLLHGGGKIL
jgi:hypothetical protein